MSDTDVKTNKKIFYYIYYGVGSLANGWSVSVIGFYINNFMLKEVKLTSFYFSLIQVFTQIINAISDPIIGVISDRTETRFGRRRPYIFVSSILMPICYILLFTVVNISNIKLRFFYYLTIYSGFYIGQTMFNVPYLSMVVDLADNEYDRNMLFISSTVFFMIGNLLGPVTFEISRIFIFTNLVNAYSYVAITSGLIMCMCIIVVFSTSKEKNIPIEKLTFKKVLKDSFSILKYRSYVILTLAYISTMMAIQGIQFNLEHYLSYVAKIESEYKMLLMLLVSILSSILFLYPLRLLLVKYNKKTAYLVGMGLFLIPFGYVLFFIPTGLSGLLLISLVAIFAGIGTSTGFFIPSTMLTDVITLDYIKTSKNREGSFSSVYTLFQKTGSGFVQFLSVVILGLSGGLSKNEQGDVLPVQPDNVRNAVKITISVIPFISILLSIFWLLFYPLTKQQTEENQRILNDVSRNK